MNVRVVQKFLLRILQQKHSYTIFFVVLSRKNTGYKNFISQPIEVSNSTNKFVIRELKVRVSPILKPNQSDKRLFGPDSEST